MTPQYPQRPSVASRAAYGLQDPSAPPTREIRMVYHHANGDSHVSIFRRGASRGSAYYNPITHQHMGANGGGNSRYQSSKYGGGAPQASKGGAQGGYQPYSEQQQYEAQRRRVTPQWY